MNVKFASQPTICFPAMAIYFLLIILLHCGTISVAQNKSTVKIGVIIDLGSRKGKEVKTAMEIAVQNSNNSKDYVFSIHPRNSGSDPLQAASAAQELIQEVKVQAITGLEIWQEAALVAEICNKAQVPVLSFAATAIAPPLAQLQWPFLVQMTSNLTEQMKFIANITHFFNWRRVIAIYEVDRYGGDSGLSTALAQELQNENSNSNIEHFIIFPPFTSLSDPEEHVREELAKLTSTSPRVFIILQMSLSLATHLFKEAKHMGLMGKDSAWIVTDIIASQLDSVNASVISSMEGVVGIKSYFSTDQPFMSFRRQFKQIFGSEYPDEDNSEPGIHALRAFDSISLITNAIDGLGGNISSSSLLLQSVLSSNFTGLSGSIGFQSGQLLDSQVFAVVNVIGKSYQEIGEVNSTANDDEKIKVLADRVIWPGKLMKRAPKGWAMPSQANTMKIGVPGRAVFDKFVKVVGENQPSGFCIDVFKEVLNLVEKKYPLPHEFIAYNGTYEDLVDHVINKTFDAIVGDVTILANRSRYVEFTQPYVESCLTMVVTEKTEAEKAWMFLRPFTKGMWAMTTAILIYTVFIVWLLERQSNPEFQGPWRNQLGTAFWFTSTSLFNSPKERIHSGYTRVVVLVWFFVVLALTSSYTANLSSMLTVPKLKPNVTDVKWLKTHNAMIGCDGDSFVWDYLIHVLKFQPDRVQKVKEEENFLDELKSGNITAAFLELPYEKALLQHHCQKRFKSKELPDRFGGFGFVFQKGSPIAADFSEAILTLSENGTLKHLEEFWFGNSNECLASQTTSETGSLSWRSFWGLYLLSAFISTICYLLFFIQQNCENHRGAYKGDSTANYDNSWTNKFVSFVSHFCSWKMRGPRVAPNNIA